MVLTRGCLLPLPSCSLPVFIVVHLVEPLSIKRASSVETLTERSRWSAQGFHSHLLPHSLLVVLLVELLELCHSALELRLKLLLRELNGKGFGGAGRAQNGREEGGRVRMMERESE